MQLVFYDTEYTAWHGSRARGWSGVNEYQEIIQIGAVKLNKKLHIERQFDILIKPHINPKLSEYIINLTGITQHEIDRRGVGLVDAIEQLHNFCGYNIDTILVSNGGDDLIIKKNLELLGQKINADNIRYYDIQPLLKKIYKVNKHISIEQAAKKNGISAQFHSAISDCIALYEIAKKHKLLEIIIKDNTKNIALSNE